MPALAYTSAIQTRVYSNLGVTSGTGAFNKTLIDNTWTSGTPGGCALDALTQLQQKGQWFSMTAPASVPDTWEQWYVALITLLAGKVIHPERQAEYRQQHDEAESAAIDAYGTIDMTAEAAAESYTLTLANIRKYVIRHCARLRRWETVDGTPRQKPRLWVPIEIIDAQVDWVLRDLWMRADWPFRRRAVTLRVVPYTCIDATYNFGTKTVSGTVAGQFSTTIAAGATVRFTGGTGITACERVAASATANGFVLTAHPAGVTGNLTTGDITLTVVNTIIDGLTATETFAGVATRQFCFTDTTGLGAMLEWAKDGTDMAILRAWSMSNNVTTGRPQKFRFENNAQLNASNASIDVFAWTYYPVPDTTYTASGEVYVKGPSVTTLAASQADFARFPVDFDPIIKDRVLAKVLIQYGSPEGERMWERTEADVELLLPSYCDVGVQDNDQSVRDVYGDYRQTRTWPGWGGGVLGGRV